MIGCKLDHDPAETVTCLLNFHHSWYRTRYGGTGSEKHLTPSQLLC